MERLFRADFVQRGEEKGGAYGAVILDYSLAWSFAHFALYGGDEARREAFLAFLGDLSGSARVDARAAFDRRFPDTEALEAAWRGHIASLKTRFLPRWSTRRGPVLRGGAPVPALAGERESP